ncbi:hypothetical protein B0G75_13914 [Paraburkholderia sp. BL18I3N2]|uniref:hypothetical protein n=1 Tax=Paraburkholderia sp. BL18I3N2 TaxID=1938799 RepID=UPI000D076D55|nr:hypothetical protein [Paraburkholderia sp. BL18I3N2]PRX19151.1 hypothetical protein B0G75_13914 [Paraburkholderia sp. BL18I3N2]
MPRGNRDEFSPTVKRALCLRVGTHCSNPGCRKPTTGPTTDKSKVNNIGQAAHIAAAAPGPGAARYDPTMTSEERSDVDNGIWLCQNCATMIDRDAARYPVTLLKEWKQQAEQVADEERGQNPVSRTELALMRAAIFKTPLGRSVSTAVAEIGLLAAKELELLDPRFAVEMNVMGRKTQLVFRAKELVTFSARVVPERRAEFSAKMQALIQHGERLEMDAAEVQLEGSALLDIFRGADGTVAFDPHLRLPAVHKILLRDPSSNAVMVIDDFIGDVVGGTQSITFEGQAFKGLCALRYRFDRSIEGKEQHQSVQWTNHYGLWEGCGVRSLPYFNKMFRYVEALHSGWSTSWTMEIDGNEVLSGSGAFTTADDIREEHLILSYVSKVRELLALWNTDVPFSKTPISSGDIQDVSDLWALLCECQRRPVKDLDLGGRCFVPRTAKEATEIRDLLVRGQPVEITLERHFDHPFNMLGTLVTVHPTTLRFSKIKLGVVGSFANITRGRPVRLTLTPSDDCVYSVDPSERPVSFVTNAAKDSTLITDATPILDRETS